MVDLVPNSNGGLIDSWSIDPQLPLGLFFDNGTISGIPAINQSEQSYTVWANNSEGSEPERVSDPTDGHGPARDSPRLIENALGRGGLELRPSRCHAEPASFRAVGGDSRK